MTLASTGPSAYWYLTRSSGAVALLLLTGTIVLGVLDVRRAQTRLLPRFAIDSLHRSVSLLAIVFLAIHILTSVLDSFARISFLDAFVPFVGSYRPFWLGLGALSMDLLLAVALTSMLRRHLGYRAWRATHWLAWASWPIALLHGLGTGSDVRSAWLLILSVLCVAAVLGAIVARALSSWRGHASRGRLALATSAAFSLFLALWVPSGPLGSEWARRSGTPSALLARSHQTNSRGASRR